MRRVGLVDNVSANTSREILMRTEVLLTIRRAEAAFEKETRKGAAETEPAWEGAGQEPGLKIWRIEQFEVKAWPEAEYGNFYEGDSYIVLQTTKDPESDKLNQDVFFWLGLDSSLDEQGTAAYKTVELDDLLDGAAVQHREVMMHESQEFNALFKQINYLKGGVASGFNHVEEGAYVAKLLQVKKVGRQTNLIEVVCQRESLNHGDAFILDAGASIYVWKGDSCSPFEAQMANMAAEALEATRNGKSTTTDDIDGAFWEALGGEGDITSAEDAAAVLPVPVEVGEGVLFQLSDADGSLGMEEVGRGELSMSMLKPFDVFLCDTGPSILVWIGGEASPKESAAAMDTANKYLVQMQKPLTTEVTVLKDGHTSGHKRFQEIFAN
uniref:Gelsolin-like domain-containing protein n=1 Tax=Phaeocystis antarctica TaxID=33657 RepID=A0A7S0HCD5_9EUKA